MSEIWLTRGLPASGKSTWAKQFVKDNNGYTVRVNMDDIRNMLGFGFHGPLAWSKDLEAAALDIQGKAILAAVKDGRDVVVDNTHLEQKMPKQIKRLFDGDIVFHVKDFSHVDADECIRRDRERAYNGDAYVGDEVIRKMANRMKNAKWVLTEEWMNDVQLSKVYEEPPYRERAILVDIDGTLAKHVARSPYDYTRVSTDAVHEHVAKMVRMYNAKGYVIIILSGRPDTNDGQVRRDTVEWLEKNNIPFDELHMRPGNRLQDNDADIKQDLFDEHIRNQYRVDLMLDDRDRVTRRMRKLGIPVLQVAPGDF